MKKFFLFLFALQSLHLLSQPVLPIRKVCSMPNSLQETSGLYVQTPDTVWSHNDSGGEPRIYQVDTFGNKIKKIEVVGGTNVDWEDLTHDAAGNLYIGDFGNNFNNRMDLRIYKMINPVNVPGEQVLAEAIQFVYEDQTEFPPPLHSLYFDCEAMIAKGDSLFLFTKDYSIPYIGHTRIYWLPLTPGMDTARYYGAFYTDNTSFPNGSITSASLSPDGGKIAIMSNRRLWVFSHFGNGNFLNGIVTPFKLPGDSQKEAVAFINDCEIYISDEFTSADGKGGNLYTVNLCDFLTSAQTPPAIPEYQTSAWPVPASGDVTLQYNIPGPLVLRVLSPTGQVLLRRTLSGSDRTVLEATVFPASGLYYYQLSGTQTTLSGHIMVLKR